MHFVNRRQAATVLAVALVATTAACSSSGPAASPSTTATTPSASQHLATLVLQPGDFPKAWTGAPHAGSGDSSDSATLRSVGACAGLNSSDGQSLLEVHSRDYKSGTLHARSSVTSYRTESAVQDDVKILMSKKINACYTAAARKAANAQASGATITKLKFVVKPGHHGGPSNVAALIESVIELRAGTRTAVVYGYSWAITGPKLEATVSFDGVGKKVPAEFQVRLVKAVAGRVARG